MIKVKHVLYILLLGLFLYYVGFQILYYFSIKEANQEACEARRKDFYGDSFNATITDIYTYDYDEKLSKTIFSVKLKDDKSTWSSYRICRGINKGFENFIAKGDSVRKVNNSFKVTVLKVDSKGQEFLMPLCPCK